MAQFEKANSVGEWLDQRLKVKTFNKVMMTEYWIPKDINFLWAMGVLLAFILSLCSNHSPTELAFSNFAIYCLLMLSSLRRFFDTLVLRFLEL